MYNFFVLIFFLKRYRIFFFIKKKKTIINLLKSPINNKKHKNQVGFIKHYLYLTINFEKKYKKVFLNFFQFYRLYTYVSWLKVFNLNNHQIIKIKTKKKFKKILILMCFYY